MLVHGGWHGGWCWNKLSPYLRAASHQVFSPTLTGLGERSHLLTPDIGLETHIRDVVAVIEYEDLHDIVLVGHSYGGMVVTGVADRVGARLAQLIYLDAFVPEDGEALIDLVRGFIEFPMREDGWRVAPLCSVEGWGVTDESDIAWAQPRIGDHPFKTLSQPLRLSDQDHTSPRGAFIQTGYNTECPPSLLRVERAKRKGFEYRELAVGHDAMISQPKELAAILLKLL